MAIDNYDLPCWQADLRVIIIIHFQFSVLNLKRYHPSPPEGREFDYHALFGNIMYFNRLQPRLPVAVMLLTGCLIRRWMQFTIR